MELDAVTEKRMREIAMDEVSKQIKPLSDMVREAHEWQLSFWSNGSGRPPGYFQMRVKADDERFQTRVKADDERYTRLASETAKQSDLLETRYEQLAAEATRLARETAKQSDVLDDVQVETAKQSKVLDTVADFIKTSNLRQLEAELRKKQREKRWRFWWPILRWVGSGVVVGALSLVGWTYHAAVPVVKILINDYLQAHPMTLDKIKGGSK